MALFQCFYRWGRLPIMEIVFVMEKTEVAPGEAIRFQTQWGMPMRGEVTFGAGAAAGETVVSLSFEHPLPQLLVDMKIGRFGVETQMMQILGENLSEFAALVEQLHAQPSTAPQRQAAVLNGPASGKAGKAAFIPEMTPGRRAPHVPGSKPALGSKLRATPPAAAPADASSDTSSPSTSSGGGLAQGRPRNGGASAAAGRQPAAAAVSRSMAAGDGGRFFYERSAHLGGPGTASGGSPQAVTFR